MDTGHLGPLLVTASNSKQNGKIILAGGKIILASGKIIFAGRKIILTGTTNILAGTLYLSFPFGRNSYVIFLHR